MARSRRSRSEEATLIGEMVGPYRVLNKVGEGGMGQVYRARDTRLNRDVALKVLPVGSQEDPESRARFRREAQLLASLNHPHIAAVHGLEETGGAVALVMEFVEGRTLASIIADARSSATGAAVSGLPLSQAIDIARQIAQAVEAAHDQGIVHRDLKPANIIVRDDGTVKVLDFGLAKMLDAGGAEPDPGALENSPTVTSPAYTRAGVILGTAAYMSPEQARGKAADKRSDIWAFGVVLYEMVTGRRLFRGEHVTDVLAAVVRDTPDLTDVPSPLRRLLEKCLEKDPRKRLHDISGVTLLLEESPATSPSPATVVRDSGAPSRTMIVAAAALVLVIAAAILLAAFFRPSAPAAPLAIEFAVDAPPGTSFAGVHTGIAISPDGHQLVFRAGKEGTAPALWFRQLGSLDARMLAGTEGATAVAWSPDGRSIVFMAAKKLKRLDLGGGAPVTLADIPRADPNQPPAWSRNGAILFGCPCGLETVPASGGTVTRVRGVDRNAGETAYAAPQFLPDGDRFLYLVSSHDEKLRGVYLSSLSEPSKRRLLLNTSHKATYVPPRGGRPGYILWLVNQTLQARAFDAGSGDWAGDPLSIADGVSLTDNVESPAAAYWASDSGMLVYSPGPGLTTIIDPTGERTAAKPAGWQWNRRLAWYGKDGKPLGDAAPEGPMNAIAISPDQNRVAITRITVSGTVRRGAIWVWDFSRKMETRVTFSHKTDENPVWSPDGRQIAFSSSRDGSFYQLYRQDASGAGEAERLTNVERHHDPLDWSPDGRYLIYREMNKATGWDLMLLPLYGDRTPIPLLQSPHSDSDARFSPDGRWVAYHSFLNGQSFEVFVQAFSGDGEIGLTGSRLQVSNGGAVPLWVAGGRELYYQRVVQKAWTREMMAVTLTASPGLAAAAPRLLLDADLAEGIHTKAVSADGRRLLLVLDPRDAPQTYVPRLIVVTDWQARLAR